MEGVAVWLSTLCREGSERAGQLRSVDWRRPVGSPSVASITSLGFLPWTSEPLSKEVLMENLIELVNSKEITFCLQSRLNPEIFLKGDFKIATENKIILYSNCTVMSSAIENILNSSI